MSSPSQSSSGRFPQSSSLPSRLYSSQSDQGARTPTLSTFRRRNNSHLTSSIFDIPSPRMTHPISFLPPHQPGQLPREGSTFIHRDYNQCSFEWQILGLRWLRAHIEDKPGGLWAVEAEMEDAEGLPEALRRGVVIGEGWYKLDMARTIPHPHSPKSTILEIAETSGTESPECQTLSLYIAALSLESQVLDYAYSATIFVGIKPVDCAAGSRFAETKWVWTTSAEWEFSKDTEFWEIQLPLLSTILERADIAATDSFSLCVQIGSPPSCKPSFTLPDSLVIPRSIIDGLGGLLDSTTGDVRFICLEHSTLPLSPRDETSGDATPSSKMRTVSRKRVLYAHSNVLKARGEYFGDLLTGGFSESEIARRSEARCTTILVDDAGFETVFWMLRFIYTNELSFADDANVRLLMDHLHIDKGEITKMLSGAPAYLGSTEWEHRRLPLDGDSPEGSVSELEFDTRTVKSVSSAGTSVSRRVSTTMSLSPPPPDLKAKPGDAVRARSVSSATSAISKTSPLSTTSSASKAPPRASVNTSSSTTPTRSRIAAGGASVLKLPANPSSVTRQTSSTASSTVASQTSPNALGRSHYPLPRLYSTPDPHHHPATAPPPASALSVYMLSHRYRLETLESLAKEHILTHMTSDNCIPMLLASYRYEDLHNDVLDFVVDHWPTVQVNPEFFKCIQEISAGTWGETGGLVLHGLFRRL